jgi:methylmalonyl-CoA mutase cobalamin-binding subunit
MGRGELSIWVERRSSAIVERILGDVVPDPRGRRRGTAVVGAVSGESHALPTIMAAVALRADQWRVHHIGADVPPDQIVDGCVQNDADVAVISVTSADPGAETGHVADALRAVGVPTLVGGPGRSIDELVEGARSAARRVARHRRGQRPA